MPIKAILPPYDDVSKTRREADPWWEIDLNQIHHVHSISKSSFMSIILGTMQTRAGQSVSVSQQQHDIHLNSLH